MDEQKHFESVEQQRDKVILIPGTTFFDRIFTKAKEVIKDEIESGEIKKEDVKSKVMEVLQEHPEIKETVDTNNVQNRFIADAGGESRMYAANKLFKSLLEHQEKVDIYVTGGLEQNTIEQGLFRSQIMKKRLEDEYGIPGDVISLGTSAANTQGNMESFLNLIETKHNLDNVEVHIVTDERHLPRSAVLLYLGAYKKTHGKELAIPEGLIESDIAPILNKFQRYQDKDKLFAEEASHQLLDLLNGLGGDVRIRIVPESSAEIIEKNANGDEKELRYAEVLKGDPYNWPHREQEAKGIVDILQGTYHAGNAGSPGKK
jgi:polyhydroxyalkanoate synthesis regulator phasin